MRIAIISDIHANLQALSTALEIIKDQRVDEIICLGDVVGYGANPNECVDIVRRQCGVVLMGNHDAASVDLAQANSFTAHAYVAAEWTHKALTLESTRFLRDLPLTHVREDILFVHASPMMPESWTYIFGEIDATFAFRYFKEKICFIGHSHFSGVFSERGGETVVNRSDRFIVNVGSVGQPRDGNPKLSFGIFDTAQWTYENVRADYDVAAAREKIVMAGLPPALGNRLLKGR